MSVQAIKDTFYAALRDRIAAGNPARTIVVRGVVRPAVLVVENELPAASVDGIALTDTFCLRWPALAIDAQGLTHLRCEIRYATDGSQGNAGMDRGRALAAMGDELRAAIGLTPQSAELGALDEITGGGATTTVDAGTRIFWTDAVFAAVTMRGERLERTATVEVFGYE